MDDDLCQAVGAINAPPVAAGATRGIDMWGNPVDIRWGADGASYEEREIKRQPGEEWEAFKARIFNRPFERPPIVNPPES